MKILVLTDSDAIVAPMVYGFVDYYTSKKSKVSIAGVNLSDINKNSLKVMDSVGITLKDNFIDTPNSKLEFQAYQLIITIGNSINVPSGLAKNVISLDFKEELDVFQESDQTKSAYKKLRKKVQKVCEQFVEEHIEGEHLSLA